MPVPTLCAESTAGVAAIRYTWPIIKRWLKIGFGVIFVVLGIAGLFLPVLQGILFLAVGVSLLASEIPWVERRVERIKARHPRAARALHNAEQWVAVRWRRLVARARRLYRRVRN